MVKKNSKKLQMTFIGYKYAKPTILVDYIGLKKLKKTQRSTYLLNQ